MTRCDAHLASATSGTVVCNLPLDHGGPHRAGVWTWDLNGPIPHTSFDQDKDAL